MEIGIPIYGDNNTMVIHSFGANIMAWFSSAVLLYDRHCHQWLRQAQSPTPHVPFLT